MKQWLKNEKISFTYRIRCSNTKDTKFKFQAFKWKQQDSYECMIYTDHTALDVNTDISIGKEIIIVGIEYTKKKYLRQHYQKHQK